jgi:hypothetical protein
VLVAVTGCVLTVAVGVVANWIKPPGKLRSSQIAAILLALTAVLTVSVALSARLAETSSSTGAKGGDIASGPSSPGTPRDAGRSLQAWVADVNRTCGRAQQQLTAMKASDGASTQEVVASLKKATDVYGTLIRDLNGLDLPSASSASTEASDWMDAYTSWYQTLLTVVQKLDVAVGAGPLAQLLQEPDVKSAESGFNAAGITAKSKGDRLGITCPGLKI